MRTSREIYEKYNIMLALQLHQLRVAAVGKFICENFEQPINKNDVILACLFHDMGNIIKFDLSVFPEFLEPEGREYWQGVKDEYVKKYGTDHHVANTAIAREIGLPQAAVACIEGIGFRKTVFVVEHPSFERKICQYADLRVGPHGVLSMEERIQEGRKRYIERQDMAADVAAPQPEFDAVLHTARRLEKQIFTNANIQPGDITDKAIASLIEELQNYSVA